MYDMIDEYFKHVCCSSRCAEALDTPAIPPRPTSPSDLYNPIPVGEVDSVITGAKPSLTLLFKRKLLLLCFRSNYEVHIRFKGNTYVLDAFITLATRSRNVVESPRSTKSLSTRSPSFWQLFVRLKIPNPTPPRFPTSIRLELPRTDRYRRGKTDNSSTHIWIQRTLRQ